MGSQRSNMVMPCSGPRARRPRSPTPRRPGRSSARAPTAAARWARRCRGTTGSPRPPPPGRPGRPRARGSPARWGPARRTRPGRSPPPRGASSRPAAARPGRSRRSCTWPWPSAWPASSGPCRPGRTARRPCSATGSVIARWLSRRHVPLVPYRTRPGAGRDAEKFLVGTLCGFGCPLSSSMRETSTKPKVRRGRMQAPPTCPPRSPSGWRRGRPRPGYRRG